MLIVLALFIFQVPQASLEGRVVRRGTDTPVVRARLLLTKVQGQLSEIRTASADDRGKFSIPNLAPGKYRLFAEREGFLRAEYGQLGASRSGTPLSFAVDQRISDLLVTMTPTGVIAGRVTDADGHPLRNVVVRALKPVYREGVRTLNAVVVSETNDLGEYRLFGLAPGRYFISGLPAPGPRIEGDAYVIPSIPSRENRNSRETRVTGIVAVASGIVYPSVFDRETNLTVYYPATIDPAAAVAIDLEQGATIGSIDLRMVRAPTVNVRGRVINGAAGPDAGSLIVSIRSRDENGTNRSTQASMGLFEITGVPPGSYEITAAQNIQPSNRLHGRLLLEVADRDVENLTLLLEPGFTLNGNVSIEGLQAGNVVEFPPPYVQFQPAGISVPVKPDGSFTAASVIPGDYRLRIAALNPDWYIKLATLGPADILNNGVHIQSDPKAPLNIVVGANGATLDALVVDGKRRPAHGVIVALVPDPSRRHRHDLYKTAVTDPAGRVHLQGIAPGQYKAFAWSEIEADSWQDPAVMRTFENRGQAVRFDEGAKQSIKLTLIDVSQ